MNILRLDFLFVWSIPPPPNIVFGVLTKRSLSNLDSSTRSLDALLDSLDDTLELLDLDLDLRTTVHVSPSAAAASASVGGEWLGEGDREEEELEWGGGPGGDLAWAAGVLQGFLLLFRIRLFLGLGLLLSNLS